MSKDLRAGEAGIVLPPDLLQPFLLRFRREELHIMAFFSGHPDYEAVEAMISYRADGTPSIRAILTRHDQSQMSGANGADEYFMPTLSAQPTSPASAEPRPARRIAATAKSTIRTSLWPLPTVS